MIANILAYLENSPYSTKSIECLDNYEVGEIINGVWLIVSTPKIYSNSAQYDPIFYKKGEYARIVNLNICPLFETDIDYSSRPDIIKMNLITQNILVKDMLIPVKVYKYQYIG